MKKNILKGLKWAGLVLVSLILLIVIAGTLFLNISPQFGGSLSEAQKAKYVETGHFQDGIFLNKKEIVMNLDCHSITSMVKQMFNPHPNVAPKNIIQVLPISPETLAQKPDSMVRITWFGHSSFLVEIDGKNILLDPVFGQYAAPHKWFGQTAV